MNKKNLFLTILTVVITSFSLTQAEYTAKLVLQADTSNGYNGNLPEGSIIFNNGSGGNGSGNNGTGESSQDPDEIVCGYSNGGGGYGNYAYHYIENAGGPDTIWFQDGWVGSNPSDIGFSDSSYRWISGGYSDWCVSTSTPYSIKPGQVKLVNQAFNFSGCNITTPGVYEYTGTTSGGEVFIIRLNVSND